MQKTAGFSAAPLNDKEFWYSLDKHLPEEEFQNKVRDKRGYILLENDKPIGLLRYNFFGTILRFAQCSLLIGITIIKVMGKGIIPSFQVLNLCAIRTSSDNSE